MGSPDTIEVNPSQCTADVCWISG